LEEGFYDQPNAAVVAWI